MISLDTETCGTDFYHSAKPFFVTICYENGEQLFWEWPVNPLTRQPRIPVEDLQEIRGIIKTDKDFVLQNPKFDVTALASIGVNGWNWKRTYDTLLAGHLLASNHPHNLTDMAIEYLGIDIEPHEKELEAAVKDARRIAKKEFPSWKIAESGLEKMPSASGQVWRNDYWLPKCLAHALDYPLDHPWHTVLARYANEDSAVTLQLWKVMEKEIKERGLWKIYLERLKLLPIAYEMEKRGITVSQTQLEESLTEYREESLETSNTCLSIAKSMGTELVLPKAGNNKSLSSFVFETMNLTPVKHSDKTGEPSLDDKVLEHYELTLPHESKESKFVIALRNKRKRDTAIAYMEGYKRFWLPYYKGKVRILDWYVLHPSLNPTGTDTLRWSSKSPNEQNISKKEGFNLRKCFGPSPGREWWSLDAKNIELRIPSYEAGEEDLIAVFNRPNDPPYYGSYHLVVFDTLYPELFAKHGKHVKDPNEEGGFESTLYQWVKNGNFAIIYGAQEETADRTYRVKGAYQRIRNRFPRIAMLNDRQIKYADHFGYVETMPDKNVDPEHGYPLLCSRTEWGRISPTTPLNYHVQGTAMWWMQSAMIRVSNYLKTLNDVHLTLQVHDELVVDFPKGNGGEPWKTNLPKVQEIKRLMELGGEDLGLPTPCSIEYHEKSWDIGKVIS